MDKDAERRPDALLLSWRHVTVMFAASLGIVLAGYALAGQVGAVASLAGLMTGAFGSGSAGRPGALAGGAGLLFAFGVLNAGAGMPVGLGLTLLLCIAAGIEAARTGTRIAIMILLGLTLLMSASDPVPLARLLVPAVTGLATGHVLTRLLSLAGAIPAGVLPPHHAMRLVLFLAGGLALAQLCALLVGDPYGHWVVLLFVSRALVPFPHRKEPLLRYGTGAAIGVGAALMIEALHLPGLVRLLIAAGALVLGLRFMIHHRPIAPAMMTLAALLGTAPTVEAALARGETVALVLGIIPLVGLGLDRLWRGVAGGDARRTSPNPRGDPQVAGPRHSAISSERSKR